MLVLATYAAPWELFAKARDAKRFSDITALKTALTLYMGQIDADNLSLGSCLEGGRCTADPGKDKGPFSNFNCGKVTADKSVGGKGWVDVNLTDFPGGTLLNSLPLDPLNNDIYFYAYACSGSKFEIDARLESEKYRTLMMSDRGDRNWCYTFTEKTCFYEAGNDVYLNL